MAATAGESLFARALREASATHEAVARNEIAREIVQEYLGNLDTVPDCIDPFDSFGEALARLIESWAATKLRHEGDSIFERMTELENAYMTNAVHARYLIPPLLLTAQTNAGKARRGLTTASTGAAEAVLVCFHHCHNPPPVTPGVRRHW